MGTILYIFLMGISLSMDAFSLSLGIGTFNLTNKEKIKLPIIVGIFHFFMPLLGSFIGLKIKNIIHFNGNLILGIILLFLALNILNQYLKKEEINVKFHFIGLITFAFGVSLDSFSLGMGLIINNYNILICAIIFSCCSFIFTYLGLLIGKYANKILGNYSKILGIVLLFIMGIIHVLK